VTAEDVPTGSPGLWRSADALLVVADLSADSVLEDVSTCLRHLADRRIELTDGVRKRPDESDPILRVPGLILANKIDLPGTEENFELLKEYLGPRVRVEPMSTRESARLSRLPGLLFQLLHVIRVYAKPPGRKPDMEEPFILPVGSDVREVARRVYRGFDHRVKSARIWGYGVADGQNVQLEHVLHDRDIVELHT